MGLAHQKRFLSQGVPERFLFVRKQFKAYCPPVTRGRPWPAMAHCSIRKVGWVRNARAAGRVILRRGRRSEMVKINQKPQKIPEHLLHIADSIRLTGNVPGAHPASTSNYHFSCSDAEFALYDTSHFLDQYFSKIDTEVTHYYTLTINLTDRAPEG